MVATAGSSPNCLKDKLSSDQQPDHLSKKQVKETRSTTITHPKTGLFFSIKRSYLQGTEHYSFMRCVGIFTLCVDLHVMGPMWYLFNDLFAPNHSLQSVVLLPLQMTITWHQQEQPTSSFFPSNLQNPKKSKNFLDGTNTELDRWADKLTG